MSEEKAHSYNIQHILPTYGGRWCVGSVYLHCDGQFSSFHFNARINSTPRSFKVPVKKVQHAHPASKAAIDFFFSQRAWLLSGLSNISRRFARYWRLFLCLCVCRWLGALVSWWRIYPILHLGKVEEMMRSSNLSSTSLNYLLFFSFFLTHMTGFAARSRPVHIRSLVSLLLQFATSQKRRRTVPPFQNAASKQRGRSNRSDN